jgi:hypothetical protein
MNPLKLYQYLGSGRPVVSTNISGVEKFKAVISIADTYDKFVECIDEQLNSNDLAKSQKRINIVRNETWKNRVKDMFKLVKEKYEAKILSQNRSV